MEECLLFGLILQVGLMVVVGLYLGVMVGLHLELLILILGVHIFDLGV